MGTLSEASTPLSAYTILDSLRDEGFRAPLQVYRALDKLVEFGLVHKLESLNAFVACQHQDCGQHEMVAFTICEDCGDVEEISSEPLTQQLTNVTEEKHFKLKQSTVELRGLCHDCREDH
jgi:Fur family zinc uptake transcriptional regulator